MDSFSGCRKNVFLPIFFRMGAIRLNSVASAYLKDEKIYIHSNLRTEDGITIEVKPFFKVGLEENPSQIGNAVLEALDNNKFFGKSSYDPKTHLEGTGCKTEKEFSRNSRLCFVEKSRKEYQFLPTEKILRKGGYQPMEDKSFSLPLTANPQLIGEALKKGLLLSSKDEQ